MTGLGFLLLLLGLTGIFVAYRRPMLVRNSGRPVEEPRHLRYLDAWQTVLFDAHADAGLVKRRVLELCNVPQEKQLAMAVERIWYWGLDGKIEREQIVLRRGRGVVYCQIYGYGSDLYVGWDAHLNVGTWLEKTVASGIDRKSGQRVRLTTVTHADQPTTEYDLADLNCLLEWTHAQVTKVVKQYTEERKIDQEIDFTIIRGDRQYTTRGADGKRKSLKDRFLRRAA
jgi:hypothetical protein